MSGLARLRVVRCGPLVSFQDGGRRGLMRFGVPASGPMDCVARAIALASLGESSDATAIEVSMGGITIESLVEPGCGPVNVAVAGGEFRVSVDGVPLEPWAVLTLRPGERLAVTAGPAGSWAYVGFAGAVQATSWLGQRATHSMSGKGGGLLSAGQVITIEAPTVDVARVGEIPVPSRDAAALSGTAISAVPSARVVLGPQDHRFAAGAIEQLLSADWRLTEAFDRMGVRLAGPTLELSAPEALSIPSEPIVRGAIQVAGDGAPTILHADHQTTGGYPKIATIVSADLDAVAQLRAGDTIRFESVTPSEAIEITRSWRSATDRIVREMAKPGRTLSQRLMLENIVHGVDVGLQE